MAEGKDFIEQLQSLPLSATKRKWQDTHRERETWLALELQSVVWNNQEISTRALLGTKNFRTTATPTEIQPIKTLKNLLKQTIGLHSWYSFISQNKILHVSGTINSKIPVQSSLYQLQPNPSIHNKSTSVSRTITCTVTCKIKRTATSSHSLRPQM